MEIVTPTEMTFTEAEEFQARIAAEMDKLKVEVGSKLKEILARALLDTEGLESIVVYGYTPGFNDGDACYHSQGDPYLNGFDSYGDECDLFGSAPLKTLKDDEDEAQEWGRGVDNAPFDRVVALISNLADTLEQELGTDWAICLRRCADGTVSWEQDYYSCGH